MAPRRFEGKTALVTGASSGIGRATATGLAAEGAKVALAGRRAARLEEVASSITSLGGESLVLACDVTKADDSERAVAETASRFGGLDVLVHAAGVIGFGTIETTTPTGWDEMMDINVTSVFRLTQLALPHLIERKGTVVVVSSVTGLRSFPGVLAYCVSKAAVDQFTRCAALELAPKGVRVNAVNPGVVVSELHKAAGLADDAYEAFLERSKTTHPLGRVGAPEEIAELVLFLASPQAGWITGATVSIDGGRHLTCAR